MNKHDLFEAARIIPDNRNLVFVSFNIQYRATLFHRSELDVILFYVSQECENIFENFDSSKDVLD